MPSNRGSSTPRQPPAAEPARPLAGGELGALFSSLSSARRVALAVSGGADSLALLDCVDRWRKTRANPPEVLVLSVDHRLRPGSRREVTNVVVLAHRRGMAGRVLTWQGAKPDADIENAARRARYRLLLDACRRAGATHLLLAHHRDDVAETFLLRLKRGAGVFGLAAMRPAIDLGEVTLVRPFLTIPRARLMATVAAAGLEPVHDPMNDDLRFDRVRVRRVLPLLAGAGVDPAELAASAFRLAAAADAIDAETTALLAQACAVDRFATAALDVRAFLAAPAIVQRRAVVRVILAIGGGDYPPRAERLSALIDQIRQKSAISRFKRTLGGVVVESRSHAIVFSREIGRSGLPDQALKPGLRGDWDRRFAVTVKRNAPAGYRLGPLGETDRAVLGIRVPGHPPAVAAALPALRRRGKIVAIHGVEGRDLPDWIVLAPLLEARLARPPLFPAFV